MVACVVLSHMLVRCYRTAWGGGWGGGVGVVACVVLSHMLVRCYRTAWGGGWGGGGGRGCTRCLVTHVGCYRTAHTCFMLRKCMCSDCRGCTVHADGNKAWKSESKRRSVKFARVSHNKMQFTKWHSKSRLTGTQALDKVWSHLKRNVPKSLCNRSKSDRHFNPRMEQYVYSYMWRFNNQDWWKQLGRLCQQQ